MARPDDPDYWVGVFHGEATSQTTYATVVVAHAGWTAEAWTFGEHPNLASAKAADLTSALEAWKRLDGRTSPGPENLDAMAEARRRVEALADHVEGLAEAPRPRAPSRGQPRERVVGRRAGHERHGRALSSSDGAGLGDWWPCPAGCSTSQGSGRTGG